ncbi:MAG TPA: hypothetical protein VHW00_19820 [Thermoanaerobaculia bacterium]|nr:hypothetical protein [Thermoanaerobaculia bacterium]
MTNVGRAFLVAWIVASATSVRANYMDGVCLSLPDRLVDGV